MDDLITLVPLLVSIEYKRDDRVDAFTCLMTIVQLSSDSQFSDFFETLGEGKRVFSDLITF